MLCRTSVSTVCAVCVYGMSICILHARLNAPLTENFVNKRMEEQSPNRNVLFYQVAGNEVASFVLPSDTRPFQQTPRPFSPSTMNITNALRTSHNHIMKSVIYGKNDSENMISKWFLHCNIAPAYDKSLCIYIL